VGPRSRIAARIGHLLAGSLALAALSACGDSWSASTTNILPNGGVGTGSSMKASASILTKMAGAPQRVPFQGKRRVEAHWMEGTTAKSLKYTELATGNGAGGFAIQPLDLIEPALPPAQANQFLLLQRAREGLFFRYRDFALRDFDLFAANWSAESADDVGPVAGRAVERMLVKRRSGGDRRYVVDVDSENGLVLRAREELLDGTLVSLVEFETLDLDPDFSAVSFHQELTSEVTLSNNLSSVARALQFQPHAPKQLPRGYELIEVAKLVDPHDSQTWAKLVYSDGVDLLFFVEAEPADTPPHQIHSAPPTEPGTLRALTIGTWTVLQARYAGRDSVVMGKQGELALADAIRSAYP
jgi:hypothetical protein